MTYFNQRPSTTLGAAVSPLRNINSWVGEPPFPFPVVCVHSLSDSSCECGILTQVGVCDTVFLSAGSSSPKMDWNPVNACWYQRSFLWVFSCLTLLRSKQEVLQNYINILIDAMKTSISECLFTSVLPLFLSILIRQLLAGSFFPESSLPTCLDEYNNWICYF